MRVVPVVLAAALLLSFAVAFTQASTEKSPSPKSRLPLDGSPMVIRSSPPSKEAEAFASPARAPGAPSVTPLRYVPATVPVSSAALDPSVSPSLQYARGVSRVGAL